MTFFWIFSSFFEKFWMIPYDKYTWEGQIFILSFTTCLLQMKSTIKLNFGKFELWWKNQSNDLSLIKSATVAWLARNTSFDKTKVCMYIFMICIWNHVIFSFSDPLTELKYQWLYDEACIWVDLIFSILLSNLLGQALCSCVVSIWICFFMDC